MRASRTNSEASGSEESKRFPAAMRIRVNETGSTNADVLGWIGQGEAPGSVLCAAHQTAGRGRLDRTWDDRHGNALLTTFLVPAQDVQGLLPLVLGVAALDVVHQRGGVAAGLKWPNDIIVSSGDGSGPRKLAGILVEVGLRSGRVAGAAAGIGMNLRAAPDDAISLAELVDSDDPELLGVDGVLDDLCDSFDSWLNRIAGGGEGVREAPGISGFLDVYRERCASLDQQVRVERTDGTSFLGTAIAIDEEGRLVVETADGQQQAVTAADVHHLRPNPSTNNPSTNNGGKSH